jgi:hypothetical protein
MAHLNPGPGIKITREEARASLRPEQREIFDDLVTGISTWSDYFYGRKFVSYAIIAELVRDGWRKERAS